MARQKYSPKTKNSGAEILIKAASTHEKSKYIPPVNPSASVLAQFNPFEATPIESIIAAYKAEDQKLYEQLASAKTGKEVLAAFEAHPWGCPKTALTKLSAQEFSKIFALLRKELLQTIEREQLSRFRVLPPSLKKAVWSSLPRAEQYRLVAIAHQEKEEAL